ncbi:hypothetical protein L6164_004784 [Bauhinia variegata]|uniref:Uncharacterized protein n=1 Tax=Bauhinia variegata TaxID=167791 RepID=A0ACB9PP63_BAUVA|nr:hypothetical protein L6164_004784 [Bauhinia variegata]
MAEPQGDDGTSGARRKAKRATAMVEAAAAAPCGACKFLRRKCINGCVFAPHFGTDQGAARFAAVHKVFGASNVSKLLLRIPVNHRQDAVVTISYEAQARLSDPVYGCVSTILALQQQVAALQAELTMVQTQLINSRIAFASAFQSTQQQLQHQQPNISYSNNSSASTNLINMRSFNPSFDLAMETAPSSQCLEPVQLSRLSQDEEDDEGESRIPQVFNHEILHR